MFVYLLTAPLLAFPVCVAFTSAGDSDIVRPWFAGAGGGILVALIETLLRLSVDRAYGAPRLFVQLLLTESVVPISLAVALFFLFARRYRSADPRTQELGMAAFLSGALTVRSMYHGLYVAGFANLYWAFLAPSLAVTAVLLIPYFVSSLRRSIGWETVAYSFGLATVVATLAAVPYLYELRYRVYSSAIAGVAAVGGVSAWVLRPIVKTGTRVAR